MGMPIDIDRYCKLVTMNDDELVASGIKNEVLERLHRIRAVYAYWLQFPTKFEKEVVTFDMGQFHVRHAQAYDDIRIVQLLLGNLQQASKDFMRWKINRDLEEDLKAARRAGDFRSVASIEKNRILNNRTDKEDEIELEYDKIIPQTFVPTDDPTVLGIKKVPNLRDRIRLLEKKYSVDENWRLQSEEVDYEELSDDRD